MRITPVNIFNWSKTQTFSDINACDVSWVLESWKELHNTSEAVLSQEMLKAINQRIKKVSTGKRRAYQKALSMIVQYLYEQLQWTVPEKQKRKIQDEANKWFESINVYSADAQKLSSLQQENMESLIKQRKEEIDVAAVAITLMLETVPLSLSHITFILNNPSSIQKQARYAILTFPISLKVEEENSQFACYKLSALSYRLLANYYQNNHRMITVKTLRAAIKQYLSAKPFYFEAVSEATLLKMVACHWQQILPHFFLQDFINPSRQFALQGEYEGRVKINCRAKAKNTSDIFNSTINLNITATNKEKWPHRKLLDDYKKRGKKAVLRCVKDESICWHPENIVPQLYYLYVIELIEFGGAKKDKLAISTIETYSGGEAYLAEHPLSYSDAIAEESLNNWAHSFYNNAKSSSAKLHIYYFLCFVAQHDLTDALDIDAFQSIYLPKRVDANLVTAKDLNGILTCLLSSTPESGLQQLFCLVVVILSYHGCLRRGEILRLRMMDIHINASKDKGFKLDITRTKEGRTKNGKSRRGHIELAEQQAELIHRLLTIKSGASPVEPLIGFAEEKISSRERQYILPVTRAIKTVCGEHVRFHHLRHGGAFVLTNQMLCLFTNKAKQVDCPYLSPLLSHEIVTKRFYYWHEGRQIDLLNSAVALDEVANMLGHSLFDTTRRSYLHGHDWLIDYFTVPVASYSKELLRFIFGVSSGSNDVSRRLILLTKNDQGNQQRVKQYKAVLKPERIEEMSVSRSKTLSWLNKNNKPFNESDWLTLWRNSLPTLPPSTLVKLSNGFCKISNACYGLNWQELSFLKQKIFNNRQSLVYKKPVMKLIRQYLERLDNPEYMLELELNQRTAAQFQTVFKLPEFLIFQKQFLLLSLHSKAKEAFVKRHFCINGEKIMVIPVTSGKTKLQLKLEVSGFPIEKLIKIYRQIFT